MKNKSRKGEKLSSKENHQSPSVLLDTHIWVWLMNGDDGLMASKALKVIQEASKSFGVLIAAISLWEVAMLESKGRLQFTLDCESWLTKAITAPGTQLIPLTPEIVVKSCNLGPDFHGDPADRIIMAASIITGATLITRDKKILEYAKKHSLPVIAA